MNYYLFCKGVKTKAVDRTFELLFYLGLEPRIYSRWDMHKYAREAYDMGIRFIGGCCGFEPYHIRAVAEEVCIFSTNFSEIGDTVTDTYKFAMACQYEYYISFLWMKCLFYGQHLFHITI